MEQETIVVGSVRNQLSDRRSVQEHTVEKYYNQERPPDFKQCGLQKIHQMWMCVFIEINIKKLLNKCISGHFIYSNDYKVPLSDMACLDFGDDPIENDYFSDIS